MKFGTFPIEQAEGVILAHSLRLADARFAKGRVLDAADIVALRDAGVREVVAARLDDDDLIEDSVAERIGAAIAHTSLTVMPPSTGRTNLVAVEPGLCVVDRDLVNEINSVDESMTVATVPSHSPVRAGQMVATIKIIPFAVPTRKMNAVMKTISGNPAPVQVLPFITRTVGVVFSELPHVPFKAKEKALRVLGARLEILGGRVDASITCRHEPDAVAEAIATQLAQGCDLILLFGASAIVDRGDVIPAAITRAGGNVTYFGMPVDPGNMLLVGSVGAVDVIGLPGCARSPKPNGFDWILERLFAGLALSGRDIAAMGVGGLISA